MLSPGQTIDRYKVEALIGSGGTAVVYRVRHRQLKTPHALKVLSVTSQSIRERMIREGQVQAALRHLNIVAVTDVLDLDGSPGLLMEYIEGPSLEDALRKYKLGWQDGEVLFQGILAGVKQAHLHGLVHRDLKPANVLLARTGEGFVPKVTDFGLAKILQGEGGTGNTRHGIAMGTPHYMAPEQIRDARNVDQRADVFSLGCILYELCTGERTFPGDEALGIYNAITHGDYVPPRVLAADLPDRLDMAIRGSLVIDPNRRIPDCATLAAVMRGEQPWDVDAPSTPASTRSATPEPRTEAPSLPVAAREPDGSTPPPAPPREERPAFPSGAGLGLGVATASETSQPPLDTNEPSLSHRVPPIPSSSPVEGTLGAEDSFERRPASPIWAIAAGVALMGGFFVLATVVVVVAAVVFTAPRPQPTVPPDVRVVDAVPAPETSAPPAASEPAEPPVVEEAPPPVTTRSGAAVTNEESTAPATPRAPTGTRTRPEASVTAATAAAAAPQTIKILSSPPTARVVIDGKELTPTPLKHDLAPGKHKVEITSGDRTERFSIDVRTGADNKWCYAFEDSTLHTGSCPR